jgi:hypothetical protein
MKKLLQSPKMLKASLNMGSRSKSGIDSRKSNIITAIVYKIEQASLAGSLHRIACCCL